MRFALFNEFTMYNDAKLTLYAPVYTFSGLHIYFDPCTHFPIAYMYILTPVHISL